MVTALDDPTVETGIAKHLKLQKFSEPLLKSITQLGVYIGQ